MSYYHNFRKPSNNATQHPPGYWLNKANQRTFILELANRLGIRKPEDWYKIRHSEVVDAGGKGFLEHFNGSFIKALTTLHPTFKWKIWHFQKVPSGFWEDSKNQRQFLDWLAKELQFKNIEDWYSIKKETVIKYGGRGLLNLYKESIINAVVANYPEFEWNKWEFRNAPKNFWKDRANQREFMEWIGRKLEIKEYDDWYKYSNKDLIKIGGRAIIDKYGSIVNALVSIYPEHKWKVWNFKTIPKNFWKNDKNVNEYIEWVRYNLNIKNMDDWYNVSTKRIISIGGRELLRKSGGLSNLLSSFYPKYEWDQSQHRKWKKSQMVLANVIKDIFPNHVVSIDFYHPNLRYELTNNRMEIDVYVHDLSLAFEYQGEQHYPNYSKQFYLFKSSNVQMIRDNEKRESCKKLNITLIDIPYWWDFKKESILATINMYRPDLIRNVPESAQPIPSTPPNKNKYKT